jgi:GNAT superfamily N-acetyltransferase
LRQVPSIRAARHEDLPGLLGLYEALSVPGEPPPEPATAVAAWSHVLGLEGSTVFVAEMDGPKPQLVSTCTLFILPDLSRMCRPQAIIDNVATLDTHRRLGLGRAVIETAIAAAWEAGCHKLVLTTGSQAEGTMRFYESIGFERNTRTVFQIRPS